MSDCCLTPNDQYEELDISKNTNFDKEDIFENHKSFMSSLNIPINDENCELSTLYWIPKFQKNQYLNLFNKRTTGYLKLCMQSKEDYYHTVTKYIHVVTSIKSTGSVT